MIRYGAIKVSKEGCRDALSRCVPSCSATQVSLRVVRLQLQGAALSRHCLPLRPPIRGEVGGYE
jgi:hypothetical protein